MDASGAMNHLNATNVSSMSSDLEEGAEDAEIFSVKTLNDFATKVFQTLKAEDLLVKPIQCVSIDFNKVKFQDFTLQQKQRAWKAILLKVCLYKTASEVISSFRDNPYRVLDPGIAEWNETLLGPRTSKKKNNKKEYIKKPLTSFFEFHRQQMAKGKITTAESGKMWQELNEETKSRYGELAKENYIKTMEEYIADHPDDEEAKSCLDKAVNGVSTPGSKKKRQTSESESTSQSSPSKKKKKKKQEIHTGLSVYISKKREEYSIENPDLDEEEIYAKLERKYHKMSGERRAKYESMAEEKNEG